MLSLYETLPVSFSMPDYALGDFSEMERNLFVYYSAPHLLGVFVRRYAYEALLVNEFLGASGFFLTVNYHCLNLKKDPRVPIEGDEILGTFGFPTSHATIIIDILVLCLFVILHLGIMFALVKWKNRPGEPPLHHKLRNLFS